MVFEPFFFFSSCYCATPLPHYLKAITANAHAYASIWAMGMQVHRLITPHAEDARFPGYLAYKTYGQSRVAMLR